MHTIKIRRPYRWQWALGSMCLWLLVPVAGFLAAPAGAEANPSGTPAKKDSRASQPKQAAFTTAVTPAEAKAGDTVAFQVTATIEPPWHIYRYSKTQPDDGPHSTQFDFFDTAGLTIQGDWTASREPTRKHEEVFKNLPFVEYYENDVTWSIQLKVPPGTPPGKKTLRCQAYYMLCSSGEGGSCTQPGRWTLPDAVLTVLPGGEAATTATAPADVKQEQASAGPAPEPSVRTPAVISGTQTPSSSPPTDAVQRSLEQGIIPFLLLSMGAGLLALVMPCVWPMVPITVNFFVKQGQASKGKTTELAIIYCLAIIAVYTLLGLFFSALFGASSLQNLASSPWLNLPVALLFLAFGISLLGLFEFRLPNFVLNASAQGESRGGYVGVMFMALTLTITSFTCTFPVVGALLVMAAGGSYFYPIIGLATFSTVLALPFFLLALAPGLLSKVPKSGDWMNAVKVVGGLLEIGAAFKFINNAEIGLGTVPEEAFFDAQTVLTIWIVLALVCGVYLLGLFRTDHDHDAIKVGPGRLLIGSLFLFLALYLTPALFGRPPHGVIWDRLIVGLLPPDVGKLKQQALVSGTDTAGGRAVKATASDPALAARQEKTFHGVVWGMSLEEALEHAKTERKPVLIDFTGVFCTNCRLMEESVMPRPDVVPLLERFVTVQLYTDRVPISSISPEAREELAEQNQIHQEKLVRANSNPYYVILNPQGEVIAALPGAHEPPKFVAFLQKAFENYELGSKVAQAVQKTGQ